MKFLGLGINGDVVKNQKGNIVLDIVPSPPKVVER